MSIKVNESDKVLTGTVDTTGNVTAGGDVEVAGAVSSATAEIGGATNYMQVEAGGTVKQVGDATVFDDINTGLNPRNTGTGRPTLASFVGGLSEFQFAVNDYADLTPIELLHGWKEGSTFEIHLHWALGGTNDTTVRGVKWQIEYSIANMVDNGGTTAFAAITPVSVESSIPSGQPALTHRYTSVVSVVGTGFKIGTQLCMQVKRIASVTNTAPAANPYLLSIGIHYEIDTLGSRERGTK